MMRSFVALGAALLLATPAVAQGLDLPQLSPRAEVKQQVGVAHVTVNYASPGKRGRTIFGELVPMDKLWRTGANSATTLETTHDISIGGAAVPAGKYAIFTIPGQAEWTVIINKNPNQGGTRKYDEKLDQARFKVKPGKVTARERLTFLFSNTTDKGADLDLEWDGLRVRIPITVDTGAQVAGNINGFVSGSSRGLANAARYHADNKDLPGALKFIDASIAVEKTWFNTWLKADFLAQSGKKKQALKLAKEAYEMGKKADYFFWKERVEKAIKEWGGK